MSTTIPEVFRTEDSRFDKLPGYEFTPNSQQTAAAVRLDPAPDLSEVFVAGRFGKALQIVPGREFRLADHVMKGSEIKRLFNERQGTIEFWIKRQWGNGTRTGHCS